MHACRDGLDGKAIVKMNVRDDRDRRALTDVRECARCIHVGHGASNDLASGIGQRTNLRKRRRRVPRVGIGHGLHRNLGSAADRDRADVNLSCLLCHFSVFLPLEQAHDVLSGDVQNECEQGAQARKVDISLELSVERLASDPLHKKEQNASAIQSGDG